MKTATREIRALEEGLRSTASRIDAELAAIGRAIAALDRAAVRAPALTVCLSRLDAVLKEAEERHRERAALRAGLDAVAAAERGASDASTRISELEAERDSRFVEIGAASWTLYPEIADGGAYRPLFEEIARLETQAEGVAKDLQALNDAKPGFFGKLRAFGSKISKRGALNKIEEERRAAFAAAGGRLSRTDFARHSSGNLRLLYDFVAQKQQAIDRTAAEREGYREEAGRQRRSLKTLTPESPEERIKAIEQVLAKAAEETEEIHRRTGRAFVDHDLRNELADASLSARFEVVRGFEADREKARKAVDRIHAEEELHALADQDRRLLEKRGALDEERRVKERQIAEVDTDLAANEQRRESLRRVIEGQQPYDGKPRS